MVEIKKPFKDGMVKVEPPSNPLLKTALHEKLKTGSSGTASGTFFVLCAIAAVQGMDIQLLPACFRALESELGMNPSKLSLLVASQGVSAAFAAPIWGSLADNGFSRKHILMFGSASWGCITFALAWVNNLGLMLLLRVFNGAALGMLTPMVQSLVADETSSSEIGSAFGWIEFSNLLLGQASAMIIVTAISNQSILGMGGWRVAYMIIGVLSLMLSVLVFALMSEKRPARAVGSVSVWRQLQRFGSYLCIPTFQVIVLQGVVGSIPWAAFTFMTMYLQYVGMADHMAGMMTAGFIVGAAFGNVLGGLIGDKLAARNRYHGRPMTAQMSVLMGIPCIYAMFKVIPPEATWWVAMTALMFNTGLVCSWCKVGCNQPVFLEIVSRQHRASAFALEYGIEGVISQMLGPVAVAFLSETLFGYKLSSEGVSTMSSLTKMTNASALGNALALCMILPWAACFMIYGVLHFTYERDATAAKLSEETPVICEESPGPHCYS